MIGVHTSQSQRRPATEFFELFKTPWEFYSKRAKYDVVLSTNEAKIDDNYKLLIIYSTPANNLQSTGFRKNDTSAPNILISKTGQHIPIYCGVQVYKVKHEILFRESKTNQPAAIYCCKDQKQIIKVGYGLFNEISYLLKNGQQLEFSNYPTIELHIDLLKEMILSAGIEMTEILPSPYNYQMTVCLTHDVDFLKFRDHYFDRTFFGFLYRSILKPVIDYHKKGISKKRILQAWTHLIKIPLVYLNIIPDYFQNIETYCRLEKDYPSTFYLLPRKNYSGKTETGTAPKHRACKYTLKSSKPLIEKLLAHNKEIGLHGIDAWLESGAGSEEINIIRKYTKEEKIGVRMHWLYYNGYSDKLLDKAGFLYDASSGYNASIGYRAGTTQVFRPLDTKCLLRLPLLIQDTALFYADRLNLSESEALAAVHRVADTVKKLGGVFTINWHNQSIGPERMWGDCYRKILKKLKKTNPWYATARDTVRFFQKRRNTRYTSVKRHNKSLKVDINGYIPDETPPLELVAYIPTIRNGGLTMKPTNEYDSYSTSIDKNGTFIFPM